MSSVEMITRSDLRWPQPIVVHCGMTTEKVTDSETTDQQRGIVCVGSQVLSSGHPNIKNITLNICFCAMMPVKVEEFRRNRRVSFVSK